MSPRSLAARVFTTSMKDEISLPVICGNISTNICFDVGSNVVLQLLWNCLVFNSKNALMPFLSIEFVLQDAIAPMRAVIFSLKLKGGSAPNAADAILIWLLAFSASGIQVVSCDKQCDLALAVKHNAKMSTSIWASKGLEPTASTTRFSESKKSSPSLAKRACAAEETPECIYCIVSIT